MGFSSQEWQEPLEVVEVATAWLTLPNGLVVLQRRPANTRIDAGKLGMFGGQIEVDEDKKPIETPDEAVRRELEEETKLSPLIIGRLALGVAIMIFVGQDVTQRDNVRFHIFSDRIPEPFEAIDGTAEIHNPNILIGREDLSGALRHITEHARLGELQEATV